MIVHKRRDSNDLTLSPARQKSAQNNSSGTSQIDDDGSSCSATVEVIHTGEDEDEDFDGEE